MVYYDPQVTGEYNPLYDPTNQGICAGSCGQFYGVGFRCFNQIFFSEVAVLFVTSFAQSYFTETRLSLYK